MEGFPLSALRLQGAQVVCGWRSGIVRTLAANIRWALKAAAAAIAAKRTRTEDDEASPVARQGRDGACSAAARAPVVAAAQHAATFGPVATRSRSARGTEKSRKYESAISAAARITTGRTITLDRIGAAS